MLLVSGIFSRIESFLNFVFSQMPQLFVEVKSFNGWQGFDSFVISIYLVILGEIWRQG